MPGETAGQTKEVARGNKGMSFKMLDSEEERRTVLGLGRSCDLKGRLMLRYFKSRWKGEIEERECGAERNGHCQHLKDTMKSEARVLDQVCLRPEDPRD